MRGTTAKFLNGIGPAPGSPRHRALKRLWKATPHTLRSALKRDIERKAEEMRAKREAELKTVEDYVQ